MKDMHSMLDELAYNMARSNKSAAIRGLADCDVLLAKIHHTESEFTTISEPNMVDLNEMFVEIIDQKIKLQIILDESQKVIDKYETTHK